MAECTGEYLLCLLLLVLCYTRLEISYHVPFDFLFCNQSNLPTKKVIDPVITVFEITFKILVDYIRIFQRVNNIDAPSVGCKIRHSIKECLW